MQALEKGVAHKDERPTMFIELRKLCGHQGLIPDSMKLQGYDNGNVEAKELNGPTFVYQSEFKGGRVAVKVIRLHVSQRSHDYPSVSVVSYEPLRSTLIRQGTEILRRGRGLETPSTYEHHPTHRCDDR
jgi:hypothetical protein